MKSSLPLSVHCLWAQPTLAVSATPAPATLSELPLAGLFSEACPSTFWIYFLSRWPSLFWCKDVTVLPISNSPFAVISFHTTKGPRGCADQHKTAGKWWEGASRRNLQDESFFCGSLLQNFSTCFQLIPPSSNIILADLQLHSTPTAHLHPNTGCSTPPSHPPALLCDLERITSCPS